MQIGTLLVVLSLSLFLATYILRPFTSPQQDWDSAIEAQVAERRKADAGAPPAQFCTQCRHRLGPDDRFCAQCGHPVAGSK